MSKHVHVAIVGAGFAGLGMAIKLQQAGKRDFLVLERGSDAGGTWRDNIYPGCQCDVPSNLYSYSFALNPKWTRTFPTQNEIWDYLRGCATKFGIADRIRYNTELVSARWDPARHVWQILTNAGEIVADVLICGQGGLSEPSIPDIPGLQDFNGPVFHSAAWDYSVDLTGKRVAVVGTGASAIQFVPKIQPQVAQLDLYQRTPAWIMPHRDRPVTTWERRLYAAIPLLQKAVRGGVYWARESFAFGFTKQPAILRFAERLGRKHLAAQVSDPVLRKKLSPNYAMGCKRILISNEFYPAVSQPNVDVIDHGVARVTANGVVDAQGTERHADVVILGTGFRVSDNTFGKRLINGEGVDLQHVWHERMSAYRGTTVAGFPNLFLITGPNTGLGHTSMVFMMESQFPYVMQALDAMEYTGSSALEVRGQAQQRWVEEIDRDTAKTVWNSGCVSWYMDGQGRNVALWPGFSWGYRKLMARFDAASYTFARKPQPAQPEGESGMEKSLVGAAS
jgi:cation diffusion facilitator CzcD-associated flavoprotein CzcO